MNPSPRIVVLSGGVGGSKFLVGLRDYIIREYGEASLPNITVIANTGDDLWLSGLRLQPDIDSVIYGLAGVKNTERGWGRKGETERVSAELHAYGSGWPWFTLGDLDLATHIARTEWLRAGFTPTEVVSRLVDRWKLGLQILPMTDSEVDTQVIFQGLTGKDSMHFQEWWTRYRAEIPPLAFENPGLIHARPGPGVLGAIDNAEVVVIAPSNPIVSIGPILSTPGIKDAIRRSNAFVVGISPIIGGEIVRGMADICLQSAQVEVSALGVAELYGARSTGGLLDAFLIDTVDEKSGVQIEKLGMSVFTQSIWMNNTTEAIDLAAATLATIK